MNNDIPKLIEISEYLKETDITILLHNMKKMLDNGNYVLTVMGQFSAGKSTLINELVGKKVLPVNKTETTAVVTYLRYGAEERAELVYSDGTIIPCSIEETMQLEQNKQERRAKSREQKLTEADSNRKTSFPKVLRLPLL